MADENLRAPQTPTVSRDTFFYVLLLESFSWKIIFVDLQFTFYYKIPISLDYLPLTRLMILSKYGIRYPGALVIRDHSTGPLATPVDVIPDSCRDIQFKILLDTFTSCNCQSAQQLYAHIQADCSWADLLSMCNSFFATLRLLPDASHVTLPPVDILCAIDVEFPDLDSAQSLNIANADPSTPHDQPGKILSPPRTANSLLGLMELPLSEPLVSTSQPEGPNPVSCLHIHQSDSTCKPATPLMGLAPRSVLHMLADSGSDITIVQRHHIIEGGQLYSFLLYVVPLDKYGAALRARGIGGGMQIIELAYIQISILVYPHP